ncbi:DNA-3-methyladenine glycosylase family protein [Pseudalkalibacillus berkeleyi]|uniref:DNA-3-methyladenine glycosylase II n=1 Tax=Pseudalkalibacillus berkeleyi TaxID=1069813 RepID=A0ABS9GY29_9BACL|nr:DNA-3-methyladenine glycosylase [Pseudalkalibacillus berkeleyi]MCF6136285.1 DNA-3-methyladenine glycosylase [Pseudalkalibacillus berkeleyi]
MENKTNILAIEGPFSFENTFQKHHRTTDTLKSMVIKPEESRFIKWINLAGKPFLLDITVVNEENGISMHQNQRVDKDIERELQTFMKRMFGTDYRLESFYEHIRENSHRVTQVTHLFHGMRVITNPDLFETTVDTIIGQQVNLKFAATLKERLIRYAGTVHRFEEDNLYIFPSPDRVAKLEYQELQDLSFSQRKSEYIIDFARLVSSGAIDLNALWNLSNQEIIDHLMPLRGIGMWTVECLMLFGLHRPNVLPAADIGLRNAVKFLYDSEKQPQTEEIRKLAEEENWYPWESYITYYLWQYLNTI